jgi:DNA polymerase alpha subunit A
MQVALRMRTRGQREGTQPGDVVQYIICKDTSDGAGTSGGAAALANRAYHPQEVLENSALQVDVHYYLSHQLHPVVSRLCAPLDATSGARLAECLGLDPSKFRSSAPSADAIAEVCSPQSHVDLFFYGTCCSRGAQQPL